MASGMQVMAADVQAAEARAGRRGFRHPTGQSAGSVDAWRADVNQPHPPPLPAVRIWSVLLPGLIELGLLFCALGVPVRRFFGGGLTPRLQ